MKHDTLPIGEYSSGTLREEDLLPCFIDILDELRLSRRDRQEVERIKRDMEREDYYESGDAHDDLNETVFDMMDCYTPPYCYFGNIVGDGSCFGCRIDHESIQESVFDHDVYYTKEDGSGVPKGYRGYIMSVNDHGNMTLYKRVSFGTGYRDIVQWSVV